MNQPWECPRCHQMNAPWMPHCNCTLATGSGFAFITSATGGNGGANPEVIYTEVTKCDICGRHHMRGVSCVRGVTVGINT